MNKSVLLASSAIGAALLMLSVLPSMAQTASSPLDKVTPVTDATLLKPSDSDWLMWRRTYNGWGYSPLNQINNKNVKDLSVAWTWALQLGPNETTPIVHDGILYIQNAGDTVQALDGATGDLLWQYQRSLPQPLIAAAGNNLAKRNMAIYGNALIVATSDVHLIALDLKTGKLLWDKTTADWSKGYRYSAGPMIADGKIIQGMTGCGSAEPGGCFIGAYSPKDGTELWRDYTIARTGSENNTWNGIPLDNRYGASVWIAGSYDPDNKVVYYGVAQPYPWIAEINGLLPASKEKGITNNALYTDSTLAIDPDTGKIKWYHQYLKTDTWDLDYIFERLLVDLPVNGKDTKQVVTAGKLGIIESLDRDNGKWLWAKQTVPQNVVTAIDPKTGDKTINPQAIPHIGATTVNCPADPGGRGWPATAYDPQNQTMYLPLNEFCSNTTPQPLDQGQIYTGGGRATFARFPVPNGDGKIGRVDAVKLTDQSTTWSYRQAAPMTSAVLPTAGGLVFGGDWNRYFRAFDAATGKVLWQIRTSNAVNSFPISYSVNGKQYVAVSVGNGSSQTTSLATLAPQIAVPQTGSSLWVFALPDSDTAKTAAAN
ncbi:MAG TPA: PQQ-binding-like beta-propeller repeat protein [Devosiaceae bacterium]|nr:PQQ-binding-like beta-propeller repeat protein [Devosiaceae bacterium]